MDETLEIVVVVGMLGWWRAIWVKGEKEGGMVERMWGRDAVRLAVAGASTGEEEGERLSTKAGHYPRGLWKTRLEAGYAPPLSDGGTGDL